MKLKDKKKEMGYKMLRQGGNYITYLGKKGKGSLEMPKGEKREYEDQLEGKNEHNRN